MSIIRVNGIAWFSGALESANRRGIVKDLCDLAADYADPDVHDYAVYPDPSGQDRIRVVRGGLGVVIGDAGFGVVIGYVQMTDEDHERAVEALRGPSGPSVTRKPRKAQRRGPTSLSELRQWLIGTGWVLVPTNGGHWQAVGPGGKVGATFAGTASDYRSFSNSLADLRRASGLELRR